MLAIRLASSIEFTQHLVCAVGVDLAHLAIAKRLLPKANQTAVGFSPRTVGIRESSEASVVWQIRPRKPTPMGSGAPADTHTLGHSLRGFSTAD